MAIGVAPPYPAPRRLDRALDLLFPPQCVGCRRIGRWICARCWPQVPWIMGWTCSVCRQATDAGGCTCSSDSMPVAVVAEFDGAAREAVHALKFEGRFAVKTMMAPLMAASLSGAWIDLVVPVPLHVSRRRERGYDQAAMLAEIIARHLQLAYAGDMLRRTRATRQQATLDRAHRQANVSGAFQAVRPLNGESVLLVDDVMTTGSTLRAAARAVQEAGAGSVRGAVFASAL